MKRLLLTMTFFLVGMIIVFAQMTDSQVRNMVVRQARGGATPSQITNQLMQRGVEIEQIRRIRNQYDAQIDRRGLSAAADGAVALAADRMQANSDGKTNSIDYILIRK